MTLANLSLLILILLPIVCAGISKAGSRRYDNHHPRDWLAAQEGYRRRATAAQQNSWEALSMFVAGFAVAHFNGASPETIGGLSAAFVLVRMVYIALYVANLALLRSLAWMVGIGLTIALFFVG